MANVGGKPEQVIGKSEIVKQTYETHVEDATKKIASALELPLNVIVLAKLLQARISEHPHWDCRRTPHALFVDCIYVVAKKVGVKITSRGIAQKTKTVLGIGTQPRPREWTGQFDSVIKELLG